MEAAAFDQPTRSSIEAGHPLEVEPQLSGRLSPVTALVLVLVYTAID
jgi:hypothetical protein